MRKKSWRDFITLCRHAHSYEELQALFELLLTLDEQEQVAMRVGLLQALLKGDKPQRVIAEDLQISIAKITRGSNALKTISPQLRDYLKEELLA